MGSAPLELDIFTRYDTNGASSRLRHWMYRDALVKAGFVPKYQPFFSSGCLERLYATGKRSPIEVADAYVRRFMALREAAPRMWIEYELLPGLYAALEFALLQRRRFVLSFDDAVWAKRDGGTLANSKFAHLAERASGIISANAILTRELSAYNANVVEIPTVPPPLPPCAPGKKPKTVRPGVFTAVWLGTPVTYRYLVSHSEHLQAMSRAVDFELLVIAGRELPPIPGVRMRFAPWSEADEIALLQSADVGIMPLDDDGFSRGKSAYKLIRCLQAGLPVIASPIGENRRVVRNGVNGFTATTPCEWAAALADLAAHAEKRCRFAKAAARSAMAYSFERYAAVLTNFLHRRLD